MAIDRFTFWKWWKRFLWGLLAFVVYWLFIMVALTSALLPLNKAWAANAAQGCTYWQVSALSVNDTVFLYAAQPWHWGKPLRAYVKTAYGQFNTKPLQQPASCQRNILPFGNVNTVSINTIWP